MKKITFSFLTILFIGYQSLFAQRVYPVVANVVVDSILKVKPNATKIALDAVSGHLFYSTLNGNIYEIFMPTSGVATDSLRFTAAQHGITFLQGLYFRDSVMYVCGNVWSATTGVGKVVKATLKANGVRVWSAVVTTNPYPSANSTGDHGFAGVCVDPAGDFIYVSSGARTHLGEIRTNNGAWPAKREVPLTTRIFKFPIAATNIVLQNDSTWVDNSGYVFAWGTRNAYDFAWDANDNLFAIDNSGERDDPEELNWLRQGKHYGYPWRMAENDNPLRVSPYNVNADPLVNHQSTGYLSGWFADDPTFPTVPAGITFTDPVRNFGTEADFYRDPITGKVKNASDEGTYIATFTSHRSPLGLEIDIDSALATPFRGDAFVLSFMPGGDSTGYSAISPWGGPCPFVDSSRELVQMKLTYNPAIDNFTMTTTNVATGFYLPVDAALAGNKMYVIENGGSLWKLTFPPFVGIDEQQIIHTALLFPNPFTQSTTIQFANTNQAPHTLSVYNAQGLEVRSFKNITADRLEIERQEMASGLYFLVIKNEQQIVATAEFVVE